MTSPLRTIRAFSSELMKIASGIKHDADVRKLLAERRGEEYLDGGRLLTNSEAEAPYANQKIASGYQAGLNAGVGSFDVLRSKKKKKNNYQTVRDYAGTALKGGLTGLGILGAANTLRGRFGSPVGPTATRQAVRAARQAATAGAGLALADRAYRHNDLPGQDKTAFAVSPGLSTNFKSPAGELARSGQTGGFRGGIIHDTGKAPQSLQLGKKFRLP